MAQKPVDNVTQIIGNTPVVKLRNVVDEDAADIYVKLEYQNPGGSVKDRIALAMIEKAEQEGILKPGSTIVEATSGNTGIGLSGVGAAKGYKVVIVMPETMTHDDLLAALKGAANKLVQEISVFDVYRGTGLPEGMKSMAVKVILQDMENTLTDETVEPVIGKLIDAATAAGAQLRS